MPFTEKRTTGNSGVAVPVQSLITAANTAPVTEEGCGCENYTKLTLKDPILEQNCN